MPAPLGRLGGLLFNRPRLLLTLTSLFWAGNIVVGRFIAGHVPPVLTSTIRWAGATLILFGFALPYLRRDWRAVKANFGIITLITLLGIGIYNTISYYALQYTQAINALLIVSTGPLLVAAVTFILFREKPTRREVIGVSVSLMGAIVVIAHGDIDVLHHLKLNIGDVAFFVAQIVYAFYTALLSKRPNIHPLSFALVTFGWGALMVAPLVFVERSFGIYPVWNSAAFAALGYIVLFPSLIAYLFYNRGVELIGPNRAAPFYHLIPLFGSALAIIFLSERPEPYHAVGYVLILAGVFIATSKAARTSAASPAAPAAAPALSPAPPAEHPRRSQSAR